MCHRVIDKVFNTLNYFNISTANPIIVSNVNDMSQLYRVNHK